jgi:hypothetical protein
MIPPELDCLGGFLSIMVGLTVAPVLQVEQEPRYSSRIVVKRKYRYKCAKGKSLNFHEAKRTSYLQFFCNLESTIVLENFKIFAEVKILATVKIFCDKRKWTRGENAKTNLTSLSYRKVEKRKVTFL